MTMQTARGAEYAELTIEVVRGYIESLSHAERLQWLGGFIGYCAGTAIGMVGREAIDLLMQATAGIAEQRLKDNEH